MECNTNKSVASKGTKLAFRFVLSLFALTVVTGVLVFPNLQKANGLTPIISSAVVACTTVCSSKATASTTITNAGDMILELLMFSTGTASCPTAATSITSTSSYSFTDEESFCSATTNGVGVRMEYWDATASTTTAQTMTVTFPTSVYATVITYEVQNVVNQFTQAGGELTQGADATTGSQAQTLAGTKTFTGPAVLIAGYVLSSSSKCFTSSGSGTGCTNAANAPNSGCASSGCPNSGPTAGAGFHQDVAQATNTGTLGKLSCGAASGDYANSCAEYGSESTVAQTAFSPSNFPWATGTFASTAYGMQGAEVWIIYQVGGVTTTTTTTTVTSTTTVASTTVTNTLGGVSIGTCGATDLSGTFLSNTTLYYYLFTPTAAGYMDNLTLFVTSSNAVSVQPVYIAFYQVPNYGGVSSSNPYLEQVSYVINVHPGDKNVRETVPLSVLQRTHLLPNQPAAIAVIGSSHIKVNNSALTAQMYSLSTGGPSTTAQLPPITFVTTSTIGGHLYFCGHFTYGLITLTTTVTITSLSGTATVTTTAQSLNAPNPTQLAFWFIPMIFMFLGVAGTTAIGGGYNRVQNKGNDGGELIFLVILGLTVGAWFGTLANVTPLGLSLFFSALTAIVLWRR